MVPLGCDCQRNVYGGVIRCAGQLRSVIMVDLDCIPQLQPINTNELVRDQLRQSGGVRRELDRASFHFRVCTRRSVDVEVSRECTK